MILQTNSQTNPEKFIACQNIIGYSFKKMLLLEKALTHTSCRVENNFSNERLEFLGDAVLGMIISDYLYKTMPHYSEGELTNVKSVVVSQSTLAKVGMEAGLKEFLLVGRGLNDRDLFPKSLLANVFEALIAAIYIDGGIEAASEFTLRYLKKEIDLVCKNQHKKKLQIDIATIQSKRIWYYPNLPVIATNRARPWQILRNSGVN